MMSKYTGKTILFSLAALSVACFVSGNKCTNVLSKSDTVEVVIKEPCIEKYTARCGWLSLNYCTFYHQTYCDKKVNETVQTYYIKTECCKGYLMASNGTCIKIKPGVIYDVRTTLATFSSRPPADPNYKEEPLVGKQKIKEVKMEISGGGYAGIACGMVLIITIAVFIVIAVRKRKRKKQELEARQAEQVLYVGPATGNQPIVRNLGQSRSPSVYYSREATPSSSKMVTPPTSPMKTPLPVEVPLIQQNVTDDDIPESNV